MKATENKSPSGSDQRGIACRRCARADWWVLYTRRMPGRIIRRRECRHCGRRVTTVEHEQGAAGYS